MLSPGFVMIEVFGRLGPVKTLAEVYRSRLQLTLNGHSNFVSLQTEREEKAVGRWPSFKKDRPGSCHSASPHRQDRRFISKDQQWLWTVFFYGVR